MTGSPASLQHDATVPSSPNLPSVTNPTRDAHERQVTLPVGPTGVVHRGPEPSRSARTAAPGAWTPTDRWAWSIGLPVSGIARAVAGCIARHANDKTGLGWPGMGTIATETGFCRRAVVNAIKELERGGHVTVGRLKVGKKNTSNRYQLPPMGGVLDALPSAPDALGGSAPDAPESVSIESVKKNSSRARVVCKICGNSWPNKPEYGTTCFECSVLCRRPPPFARLSLHTVNIVAHSYSGTKGSSPAPRPGRTVSPAARPTS